MCCLFCFMLQLFSVAGDSVCEKIYQRQDDRQGLGRGLSYLPSSTGRRRHSLHGSPLALLFGDCVGQFGSCPSILLFHDALRQFFSAREQCLTLAFVNRWFRTALSFHWLTLEVIPPTLPAASPTHTYMRRNYFIFHSNFIFPCVMVL